MGGSINGVYDLLGSVEFVVGFGAWIERLELAWLYHTLYTYVLLIETSNVRSLSLLWHFVVQQ
jgi:hypothetical protein